MLTAVGHLPPWISHVFVASSSIVYEGYLGWKKEVGSWGQIMVDWKTTNLTEEEHNTRQTARSKTN